METYHFIETYAEPYLWLEKRCTSIPGLITEGVAGVEKHTPGASARAATRSSRELAEKRHWRGTLKRIARRRSDKAQCGFNPGVVNRWAVQPSAQSLKPLRSYYSGKE